MNSNRVNRLSVPMSLILTLFLAALAHADVIETLDFTGTATCQPGYTICGTFGSGPITGSYSLDVNTQTLVGDWSFSTPFGSLSSTDPGSGDGLGPRFGDTNLYFEVTTYSPRFFEFVQLYFDPANLQEIGPLAADNTSDACVNSPGGYNGQPSCYPAYFVTGSNSLVSSATTPEPSSIVLLATVAVGLLVLNLGCLRQHSRRVRWLPRL